jgi:hypothetical protein
MGVVMDVCIKYPGVQLELGGLVYVSELKGCVIGITYDSCLGNPTKISDTGKARINGGLLT